MLNSAERFYLSGSDNPLISHFYSFEAKDSVEATFAIPDGCVDILFDCDSSHPTAEVFGTPMKAIDIDLNSHHRYFGVRFVSGTMPDFLNVSAEELIEQHFAFQELVPESNQVFEAIVGSASFAEQIEIFGRFCDGKEMRKSSRLTTQAIRSICESHGSIHINDLEALTGYTTRSLQRQFRADMGMSPKAFSQIIRCQSAVYDINHSDQVAFSDLASDLGFSDQSHFSREFKKQVNTTPLDYLKRVKHETYLERIRYV
ncbi:helix-turn-helix domain-containing protein [Oceanobacter sp. 5_MG-2023]|uniref:helix-turn-helix domain-containing protein n=1 Tax=Oceanobacter sp. 5_MG-2023 TaxID=3062645 RepID=UPI0026E47EEA|nr:helix-turn-helix domain-containing protein [Oceanobacter sp. 5_MG-2023]MDO6682828.1 helix-turn-helix domain-containing protein [Oceanobacter sp. 5_MG-2023]